MNINIKTTNITLKPETEAYLTKKLEGIKKFIDLEDENVFAQVELGKTTNHHKSGNIFLAEINLRAGKKTYRVVSEKEDLHAAIDDMKDELLAEVKTYHEKQRTIHRKGAAEIKNIVKGVENE